MEIIRLIVGPLVTNCYIVYSRLFKGLGKEGIVIDPGGECEKIMQVVKQYNVKIKAVINTHQHEDHIACNEVLRKTWKCPVLVGFASEKVEDKSTKLLKDGDIIEVGETKLQVMASPGHCYGGISLFWIKGRYLFCGDVFFKNSFGRTDLSGGDEKKLRKTIKTFLKLPSNTIVCPGHGEVFTIGEWKNENFFGF